MAPSNQSITPDTNTSPSTSSSNKDLPIELWMQISEHVRSEDYARPRSVAEYAASLALHGDDGIEAAKSLPHLERESWRRSRPLYTINRNSRAAALKLRLCLRVLQTCEVPVLASKCLEEWDALSVSSRQLLGTPKAEAGPAAQKCVVLQLYPSDSYGSGREEMYKELHAVFRLLMEHDAAAVYLRLDTARHVALLSDPCWQTRKRDSWARLLKERASEFWERKGITDGQMDVL
jgi:hypothetical protein